MSEHQIDECLERPIDQAYETVKAAFLNRIKKIRLGPKAYTNEVREKVEGATTEALEKWPTEKREYQNAGLDGYIDCAYSVMLEAIGVAIADELYPKCNKPSWL